MDTFGLSISPSRLKTYMMCSFKYYLVYVLGLRKGDSFATLNGRIIHSQLERILYGHKKWWKEELFWEYKKRKPWELHKNFKTTSYNRKGDLLHHENCLGCRLLDVVPQYHGRIAELQTSNNYCPLWHLQEGIDLIQGVIDRVVSPFDYKVIDVERKFKLPIGEGVHITGVIDLVSEVSDRILEVRDWKTGNWVPKYEDQVKDPQLRIYDLAASILYPEYQTRILTFDYLKKKPFTFTVGDHEREYNRRWIIEMVHRIEADYNPDRISRVPKKWHQCKNLCDPEACVEQWPLRRNILKNLQEGSDDGFKILQ